jgi:N-acetylglucosaminyl-diphospho-decaprenol L-rhamnosyltransferase
MNRVATPIAAYESAPVSVTPGPRVSVVMVVYRTGESLGESLAKVLAEPLVDELVVVDNGSTPAEATIVADLARSDPRVVRLCGQGNVRSPAWWGAAC